MNDDIPVYVNTTVPRGQLYTFPAGHTVLVELGIDIPAGTWAHVVHPSDLNAEETQ